MTHDTDGNPPRDRESVSTTKGIPVMQKNEDPFLNPRYLRERAIRHESECRVTATYLCNPLSPTLIHPCPYRKCRREQLCSGPMCPSDYLAERQFELRKMGFETHAPTTLPRCMIGADTTILKQFRELKAQFCGWLSKLPEREWSEVGKLMKLGRWCVTTPPEEDNSQPADK